ncbi:MAG: hypothetical protein ACYC0V_10665 [Armatimonadota bacterium]
MRELTKHYIHWSMNGRFVRAIMTATVLAFIIAMFIPGYEDLRIGLVDSVIGILIGLFIGNHIGRRYTHAIYDALLEADGDVLQFTMVWNSKWKYLSFQLYAAAVWLVSVSISVLITYWICRYFILHWPWCGVPGFSCALTIYLSILNRYVHWYDKLPDS